ncbi:phosphoglycerate/bisphosphoglycerate mutase [Planoprotostelium fungivorum]|uniref:Phosphoglycerate/bisphosphoglycerate mutase n=1 Tax=Planoprotostelium fungivorum TaxID=1890364 RepID=A0A2P6NPD7_9EUKA|nr:phosphoglycerate/bisphosphoglycerate mutase [Planoprotostelium fungivorum]
MEHPSTLTFTTTIGTLRLDMITRSNTPEVCYVLEKFFTLVLSGQYANVSVHRVIKNFLFAFGTNNREEVTLFDFPPNSGLSFDGRGVVALARGGDIIVSLDACNSLQGKYMIIGKVENESLPLLSRIEELETDERDKPILSFTLALSSIDHLDDDYRDELERKKQQIKSSTATPAKRPSTPPAPIEYSESPQKANVNRDAPVITNRKRRLTESGKTMSIVKRPTIDEEEKLKRHKLNRNASIILNNQQVLAQPFCAHTDNHMARSSSMPSLDSRFYSNVRPKWPKRLVIIRHGQSEQNAALDLMDPNIDALSSVRDADIKLTPLGRWQATETGKYLAGGEKFDICFSSPYQRAMDTAELIRKELPYNLKQYTDNWLREKEFGRLHGLDDKSVKEKFPEEVSIRKRDGRYWYKFPGGENYPAVEIRVHLFLEKICRDYAGRSVLVVTHQVPYKLFRGRLQYLDEAGVLGLEVTPNCGIQEYVIDRLKNPEGRMKLKNWNLVAYDPTQAPHQPHK